MSSGTSIGENNLFIAIKVTFGDSSNSNQNWKPLLKYYTGTEKLYQLF